MALTAIVSGGTVYDGSGAPGVVADVLIEGDRVVGVGPAPHESGAQVLDASGLAVVPGFVNVLSHAWGTLQVDGAAPSDVAQGVTTEVFGEAFSLGPADEQVDQHLRGFLGDSGDAVRLSFPRLADGLDHVERHGVAVNVASLVGGHNLRILGAGFTPGAMTGEALDRACGVLAEELQDGALGVGTALIYPPGSWAETAELRTLCEVIGRYDGIYMSHLRSEGDRFLECLDELLGLGRDGGCRVEAYHLKAAGRANWPKMAQAIERIQAARDAGQPVSADMYPYTAGGTALSASLPPRFHEGGPGALRERLAHPAQRTAMAAGLREVDPGSENLYLAAGADGIRFVGDLAEGTPARGLTLTQLTTDLGSSTPEEALVEVLRRDPSVGVLYVIADEANVELGLRQPWVSIGSDAGSGSTGQDVLYGGHPRGYGTFARFLGHYARDRGVAAFAEAVRRMTSLPADNLGLAGRGRITEGCYADVVVLDPDTVNDTATYERPSSLAVGVRHVLVNGEPVMRDGTRTPARPGRRLRRGR